MAIVSCPDCSKKLKVADTSVGKKVKCSCGNVFVAGKDEAAPAKASSAAPEKVLVACTECGAKLKVATTSLGKKMKCPKCAGVFTASAEEEVPAKKPTKPAFKPAHTDDDVDPPAPKVKGKAVSDDDMDDLFSFAQKDAQTGSEDENEFHDDEEEVKPKAKAKPAKKADPDADEDEDDAPAAKGKSAKKADPDDAFDDDDAPTPKSNLGKKGAKPPRSSDGDDDGDKKPVYPRRTVLNLFVYLLLFGFLTFFSLVFFGVISDLGLPKSKAPLAKGKKSDEAKQKKEQEAIAENKKEAAKFNGTWIVESADMAAMKGRKFVFADGIVTTPDPVVAPFTVDASQDPKWIDLPTPVKVTVPGIYKLDGETLQWRIALLKKDVINGKEVFQPGDRPAKFDAKEGVLVVLKREKQKDDGDKDKEKDKSQDKDLTEAKKKVAKVQIAALMAAATAFAAKNSLRYPATLNELVEGNPRYLESKDALIDPWENPYQYDPNGPRHNGLRPDIWTETPDKEVIGNWPKENAKTKDKDKRKDKNKTPENKDGEIGHSLVGPR